MNTEKESGVKEIKKHELIKLCRSKKSLEPAQIALIEDKIDVETFREITEYFEEFVDLQIAKLKNKLKELDLGDINSAEIAMQQGRISSKQYERLKYVFEN